MYEENEYLESDVVNAAAMRLLPSLSNIEAEQSVLGSILLDDTAIDKCGKLSVKSFYHIGHQLIFQTMIYLSFRGGSVAIPIFSHSFPAFSQYFPIFIFNNILYISYGYIIYLIIFPIFPVF